MKKNNNKFIILETYCFGKALKLDKNNAVLSNKQEKYKSYLKKEIGSRNIYSDPDRIWVKSNKEYYDKIAEIFKYNCMVNNKIVLKDKNEVEYHTDVFGFSAPDGNCKHPYQKIIDLDSCDKNIELIIESIVKTRTIGGGFIFPYEIWNYYNIQSGVKGYLEDRVDLKLNEIKDCITFMNLDKNDKENFYDNHKHNLLLSKYKNEKEEKSESVYANSFENFFKKFKSFEEYVKTFKFDDFVEKNGKDIITGIIDIVNSNIEKEEIKCLNEDINYELYERELQLNGNCKKEIQNCEDIDKLKRIIKNVSLLIEKRSIRMLCD